MRYHRDQIRLFLAIATADSTDRSSLVAAALCDTGEVATLLDITSKKHNALVGQSYSTHRTLYDELRVFEQRIANTQDEAFVGALLAGNVWKGPRRYR